MIRTRYLSTLAIAALIGAAPAFAQTPAAKPLCSELHHPNAGKLAAKDTGQAKDHSSSAVHVDCIADSPVSDSTRTATGAEAGMGASTGNPADTSTGDPSLSSTTTTTTADPSLSGGTDASANGTSTDAATTAKAKKKKQ